MTTRRNKDPIEDKIVDVVVMILSPFVDAWDWIKKHLK